MLLFDPKKEMPPFFYQRFEQQQFMKRENKELKFVFDRVYGENSTNKDVFETTSKEILASIMSGYNSTIFVYGATGAGKTFTMFGNDEQPGVIRLSMEKLFYAFNVHEEKTKFDIGMSYLEVYEENVYDLLKPSKTPLQLQEDAKYGVKVAGLTIHIVKSVGDILNMLDNGNKNRTQHPTDANANSSRSHAVFQVYIKMMYKTSGQLRRVKLSFVDLAGSERASASGCSGDRFKEAANINKSLLSLGNCINKLANGSRYIPYRDSKLTRLLKDSLSGNCKTVMIANISPSYASYEDTYNTLKYAARASKIQLNVKKNIVDGDLRPPQSVSINEELRKKVIELEAKLSLSNVKPIVKEDNENIKLEWQRRISEAYAVQSILEKELLELMTRQRVLAFRHRLHTRAFSHIADLARSSSSEALEQVDTEDISCQERAAENYAAKSVKLDTKIKFSWIKWHESRQKMHDMFNQALSECPEQRDFVEKVKLQSEMRIVRARNNLGHQLLYMLNEKVNTLTEHVSDMSGMLKKLYSTLKGYDKATPALEAEYFEIMKKAKSAEGKTCSDEDSESDFKLFSTLDLEKLMTTSDFNIALKKYANTTIDIATDSEDIENPDPSQSLARKRKGTPIKLANNEIIIINDSPELLDTTINSKSAIMKPDVNLPVKKKLLSKSRETYTIQRNLNLLNDKAAKIVKPVVDLGVPLLRVPPTMKGNRPLPGSSSSLTASSGIPLQRNGKAVRERDQFRMHPYSRPVATASRKQGQTKRTERF
ncbi:unnamed protein product [Parnassius apollo]|uniref:(apollo) hypothetical protein n=1 Tax=Parnassius apollo TaxID=110799 RepID=A0A8S3VZQ1_PARAO|nr:unnamed protein product [Parnassius apollo]